MQTYSKFRPTAFDSAGICLPDRQDWLVLDVSRNRDSGPLAESNFDTALNMLGGESDSVEVHRFGHWGPGWFELILIKPGTDQVKTGEEIESSLEDYPVLDDEDHSRREYEEYCESWDSWGRCDYVEQITKELFSQYADGVSEEFPDSEIEDAVSELDSEAIDALRDAAAEKVNWEYQSEDSGVRINIRGLVEKTDYDRLADLAIEYCRQS